MASVDLQEKANFTRLCRLLVDKGTEAFRNTLHSIHPPASLPAVLNANRTSLLKLKPRVINNFQWDLLFPPSGNPPDAKTFDVTLLTVLFRNICGLPSTGWSAMPLDTDRSVQANIVRIKLFRNEVYAHVTSTQVDNATFESLWQKISQALVELNTPQNDIDDLKTCPLGPEEEIYVETLKDWKSQDDECIKLLGGINNDVKSIERSIKRFTQITEDKCDDVKCSIDRLTQITEENHDGIYQLCQSVLEKHSDKEASRSLITLTSQFSEDNTNVEKNCNKEGDENLLRKLAKHNFKSTIRRKVKFFLPGTREWLLKRMDKWFIATEHDSRMLLLTAGPGFGKSVFAAKVCEYFKNKGQLAASHFCDFSNSNLRDPMMMLQSLASQMCENITGFKEKLLDQLKRPHQVRSLKDAFRIYLQNPLDELELEEPSLVVIDGLDESAADDKNEIMNLITDYFPNLPECIKVLVTSRPEISVAKVRGLQKINIANDDAENESDLEVYFKALLPSLPDKIISQINNSIIYISVYTALVTKCEGSFLYAFYVQSELRKRDDLAKMTFEEIIEFLPEGLNSIYRAYFKRLEDEVKYVWHENLDVLRILEMLAACKAPLPLTFVTRALGLVPDCRETKSIINKVNETVSCLLYVSDDLVTVFHKSVFDWLLARSYKEHEYTVKVSDGNRSLWLMCEQVFKEIKKSVCSGHGLNLTTDVKYALEHGLQHLVACNMKESFFWLMDVVIIHVLSTIHPQERIQYMLNLWEGILQGAVVISDELRSLISWHVVEMKAIDSFFATYPGENSSLYYLQSVLTHSPKGYFSDNEKKIAESFISKVPRFVEFNFYEVEVLPLAVWCIPMSGIEGGSLLRAVGVSHDKTLAAVAQDNGTIIVISVPSLVKLLQYSTEYKSISCCTFAPDDSFVLFGKLETGLNVAARKEAPFFHGNKETFKSCAFSSNGKRLVTSNGSSTVKLWDVVKQSLLSLLCAEDPVNWCSFSSTGLFIIAESKSHARDSFCAWNAITWQRSDERNLPEVNLKEPEVFQSKKCKRCFRPGLKELNSSKRLQIETCLPSKFSGKERKTWSTGVYNGVECIFALDDDSLSVIESAHFTTLAAWNVFVDISDFSLFDKDFVGKITAIGDDLWFHADVEKLIVVRTLAPTQEQSSCLPRPTRVLSSSFSPDGSRLATCTSDGYINIWDVYIGQVEQRFKSNQGESLFACWWSEKFLFVFDFFGRVPSLSNYPVDVNLKILFTQSQQVSLYHFVDELVSLLAIVDFSEGFLIFECGKKKLLKVLDVSGVGGPRMVTLPGIMPRMSITVSSGASFVFGGGDTYCIWKRNSEEPAVYEVFFTEAGKDFYETCILPELDFDEMELFSGAEHDFLCCFSNDSKIAVVSDLVRSEHVYSKIFELDTGNHKRVSFESNSINYKQYFCLNKDRIVIVAAHHFFQIFDMDSGAPLESSFVRYLTKDSIMQTKLSPKETMLAFSKINGDMEFLRLCIPSNLLLSRIKREAAIKLRDRMKMLKERYEDLSD